MPMTGVDRPVSMRDRTASTYHAIPSLDKGRAC